MTGKAASAEPAGTGTLAGTSTLDGSLLLRGTLIGADCTGVMAIERDSAAPLGSVRFGGASAVTVGGNWFTVTGTSTLLPFSGPAVIVAIPGRIPVIGTGTVTAPAGTVTVPDAFRTPVGTVTIITTVSVACAAFSVSVSVVDAPTRSVAGAGVRLTTVGNGGRTWTAACLVVSFRGPAAIVAVPDAIAVTGIEAVIRPAGTVTEAGTVKTAEGFAESGMMVSVICVAFIVTMHWPVAPTVSAAGQANALTVGSDGCTVTADVALAPFRATVTVAVPRARPVIGSEAVRVCAGTMM